MAKSIAVGTRRRHRASNGRQVTHADNGTRAASHDGRSVEENVVAISGVPLRATRSRHFFAKRLGCLAAEITKPPRNGGGLGASGTYR